MKHTSAASLAQAMEKRVRDKKATVREALRSAARQLEDDLVELTSGTTKQSELNAKGNPFGRGFTNPRGGRRGRVRPLPINRQTGRLQESIYRRKTTENGEEAWRVGFALTARDGQRFVLRQGGTTRMIDRGFQKEKDKRVKARRLGIRRAFRK